MYFTEMRHGIEAYEV